MRWHPKHRRFGKLEGISRAYDDDHTNSAQQRQMESVFELRFLFHIIEIYLSRWAEEWASFNDVDGGLQFLPALTKLSLRQAPFVFY